MKKHLAWPALAAGVFLVFYHLSTTPIEDWDEARRGVNALSMLRSGDFFTYQYLGEFDDFNTKPPLFTWLLALSFAGLEPGAFALRLPSALCFVLFLGSAYAFLRRRLEPGVVALTLAMLVLANGILGEHVARSGDTDMLFVLLVTQSIFSLIRYGETWATRHLLFSLGWLWLAFLTKSLSIFLILPGMLLGLLHAFGPPKPSRSLLPPLLLTGTVMGLLTVALLLNFGTVGGKYPNLLQAILLNDGVSRFTDAGFESGYKWDYLLVALDLKFGVFSYLLCGALLWCLVSSVARARAKALLQVPALRMFGCVAASVFAVLLLSQNKHVWYIAPAILPLAVLTAALLVALFEKVRGASVLVGALLVGLFVLKTQQISAAAVGSGCQQNQLPSVPYARLTVEQGTPQSCVFCLYLNYPQRKIQRTVDPSQAQATAVDSLRCGGKAVYFQE